MPLDIERLEAQLAEAQEVVNAPDFFSKEQATISAALEHMNNIESTLSQKYARWDELESMLKDAQQ